MEVLMELKDVKKIYRMGQEKVAALNGVSLQVQKGDICCLVGPSGSGKSTLLNMMAGLEKPSAGTIRFKKYKIEKMKENQLAQFRRKHIGFIFQSYHLIPTLNAMENISLPLVFKGVSRTERHKRAVQMLKSIGLLERRKHKPSQMSGGQQQRVSIARAFVNAPEIIFADEPTGNLDTRTADEMMHLMLRLASEYQQTLVIVTHNTELAIYANKVVYIRDGLVERIEIKEALTYDKIQAMSIEEKHVHDLAEEEKLEKEMQLGQETASVQETEQGHDAQTELEVTEGTEQNKPEGGLKEEK